MPIGAAEGILEVENAKFSASEFIATTSVGIGTTSASAYPLVIFKETEPEIRIQEGETQSSGARLYSNNSNLYIQTGTDFSSGSAGDIAFQTMGGQSTHVVVKGDGKVGVGTDNPTTALQINRSFNTEGDTSAMISFENTYSTYYDWQIGPSLLSNATMFKIRGNANGFGNLKDIFNMKGDRIGINTTNPLADIHIKQRQTDYYTQNTGLCIEANGTSSFWKIVASSYSTQSGNLAFGQSTNGTTWTDRGYIDDGITNNPRMNTFTGQHRCFLRGIPRSHITEKVGFIVSANKNKYTMVSGDIVTGQDAIEISESIPDISISQKAYDKACFGVISDVEDPDSREDLYGAFGTPFPKEKGDDRVYVNSLGEGAIWVTNTNGSLESGDYITSSNVAGYGMKQDNEFLANYTVAKITMDCDFNPPTQPKQQIVKELSNVNYYKNTSNATINENEYNHLTNEQKEEYTLEVREEMVNVLDEHGQLQWEDHPTETEKAYKIRYLTADGTQTDEANAVHIAAFVGCTYHCG